MLMLNAKSSFPRSMHPQLPPCHHSPPPHHLPLPTSQFCMSGDFTLEATREAIEEVTTHLDECDEAFVFILSDANLERYGIRPSDLAKELTANPKVNAHACFLASLGGAAERLKQALPPGKASVCLDAADLPQAFRSMLTAGVLGDEESK